MKEVRVNKRYLLCDIKKNREKHIAEFNEAMEDYRLDALAKTAQAIDLLREIDKSLSNKNVEVYATITSKIYDILSLPIPESYVSDYDKVIMMLERSVDDEILIDKDEVTKYVMDEWNWKASFDNTRMSYSNKMSGSK